MRKRKMTLKLRSRTPSLLQDSTSLPQLRNPGLLDAQFLLNFSQDREVMCGCYRNVGLFRCFFQYVPLEAQIIIGHVAVPAKSLF